MFWDEAEIVRKKRLLLNNFGSAIDTTPNAFSFVDQTDVALSSTITSAAIVVADIDAPAAISVSGGTYSINGGAYTAVAGTVVNGDSVTVRHTSSASPSTATNTVLTIGGVSDTFTSTTTTEVALLMASGVIRLVGASLLTPEGVVQV